ncbi:hypothetical protein Q8A64_03790 [Oxalobacteraceae bacterium R-40]|uniref:Uncharacterized protein n=1 Tax=Keguizhuia sedimenti TaxID=3064264 RepID=A0ABU1BKL5_9BURK|nr:hypothetical protein [Oxalobacteraceae bacterium R-40]
MDAGAILQRTDIGRDTIRTKSVKLTQSERLLLILVDGATPFEKLRQKVWTLTDDRFRRALNTLLQKDLVYEVLFPLGDHEAEELDSAIVDRFLQQDALDPVTIIGFDPEDELDTNLIEAMGYSASPSNSPISKEKRPSEGLSIPALNITAPISLPAHSEAIPPTPPAPVSAIPVPVASVTATPIPEPAQQQVANIPEMSPAQLQYKKDLDQHVVDEIAALTLMINAKKSPEKEGLNKESRSHKERAGNRIYWKDYLVEGCSLLGLATGIIILVIITARHLF